jgi:hypothetical protein
MIETQGTAGDLEMDLGFQPEGLEQHSPGQRPGFDGFYYYSSLKGWDR